MPDESDLSSARRVVLNGLIIIEAPAARYRYRANNNTVLLSTLSVRPSTRSLPPNRLRYSINISCV